MEKQEIGVKRLGRVIQASFNVQGINDRHVMAITKSIYGRGINKDTVCRLRNGSTIDPKQETLQKLAPLLFIVDHFKLVNGDLIGQPVLLFDRDYDFEKSTVLRMVRSVHDLPDARYRYSTWQDLQRIIDLQTPVKKVMVVQRTTVKR